jgi:hypothetical protein
MFMQPEHSGRNGTSPDLYTPEKLEPTRKIANHQKLRGNLARENENVTDKLGLTIYKHSQWGKKCRGEICFEKMVHRGLPPSTKRIKEGSSHCHVCVLAANQFESDVYKPKKMLKPSRQTSNIQNMWYPTHAEVLAFGSWQMIITCFRGLVVDRC